MIFEINKILNKKFRNLDIPIIFVAEQHSVIFSLGKLVNVNV